jgi:hypothetical protein
MLATHPLSEANVRRPTLIPDNPTAGVPKRLAIRASERGCETLPLQTGRSTRARPFHIAKQEHADWRGSSALPVVTTRINAAADRARSQKILSGSVRQRTGAHGRMRQKAGWFHAHRDIRFQTIGLRAGSRSPPPPPKYVAPPRVGDRDPTARTRRQPAKPDIAAALA